MTEFTGIAKILMVTGAVLFGLGIFFWLGGKIPGIGRLPGDILIKGKNFTFYFPLTTCILLSVVFSLLSLWLRRR